MLFIIIFCLLGGVILASKTNKVNVSEYCYRKALSLIDYCGDIRKGGGTYSKNFSPNNIRRIYISAEGCAVMYHLTMGGKKIKTVSFEPELVMKARESVGYKPALIALKADRICASIEEIVFCLNDRAGLGMDGMDGDFSILLAGSQLGTDLNALKRRYSRLTSVIMADCTISEFLRGTEDFNASDKLLKDSDFVKGCSNIQDTGNEDWYKKYGSSAQYYTLDANGSPLNNHFKLLIDKIEKAKRESAIKEFVGSSEDEDTNKIERLYNQAVIMINAWNYLCQGYTDGMLFGKYLSDMKEVRLSLYKGIEANDCKYIRVIDEDGNNEEKLTKFVNVMRDKLESKAECVARCISEVCVGVGGTELKQLLCERRISVESISVRSNTLKSGVFSKYCRSGSSIRDSVQGLCDIISIGCFK